jgi:hypothetical protein
MRDDLVRAPVFVVGAGRSGTTLVRAALSAHSRIAVPPETHFLHTARPHGGLDGKVDDPDAFWRSYAEHPRFLDLGIDAARCRALFDRQRDPRMAAVFRAILAAWLEQTGKPRVGEKTPGHARYMPQILREFPDARIVVLQRDPRAVVASQLKTPWVLAGMGGGSVREGFIARSRMRQVAHYAENWRRIYADHLPAVAGDERVAVFRYEDLVAAPREEFGRMCAFLGEAFEPAMIEERDGAAAQPAADAHREDTWRDWHEAHDARSRAPVTDASVNLWRGELGAADVALVEGACFDAMTRAGYIPLLSSWPRGGGRLGAGLIGGLARIEGRVRSAMKRDAAG